MQILIVISNLMLPLVFVIILSYGISKGVKVYDTFIEGAKDGMSCAVDIMPTLVGLMMAVGILRSSGALDIFSRIISPLTDLIHYPSELVPLTLMRLVSSSASTGILLDLFKQYGPDSGIGRLVSVMMSCTETVFYTMSVYFMSVRITKTRYTLPGALIANFAGILASVFICKIIWGQIH